MYGDKKVNKLVSGQIIALSPDRKFAKLLLDDDEDVQMTLDMRITDPEFSDIVNATKEPVKLARPSKNDPQTLRLVETFDACVFPNSGRNYLQQEGTIISDAAYQVFPINSTEQILKGDRITKADGTHIYVRQPNKINNIVWLDCESEAV